MDFSATETELMKLQQLLQCPSCHEQMQKPFYLVNCGHTFCNDCLISKLAVEASCPRCHVPSHPKDMHLDDRLQGVVAFFNDIGRVLNECEFASPTRSNRRATIANDDDLFEAPLPVLKSPRRLSSGKRARALNQQLQEAVDDTIAANPATVKSKPIHSDKASAPSEVTPLRSEALQTKRATAARKDTLQPYCDPKNDSTVDNDDESALPSRSTRAKASKRSPRVTVTTSKNTKDQRTKKLTRALSRRQSGPKAKRQPKSKATAASRRSNRQLRDTTNNSTSSDTVNKAKQGQPAAKRAKNVDRRNAYGESPLQVAAKTDKLGKVQSLLEQGANPNFQDHAGWSPLHEACQGGFDAVVAVLLSKGSNPNLQAQSKDTPLHDAVVGDYESIAKLLMSFGANPNVINNRSQSCHDLCSSTRMRKILATVKHTEHADVAEPQVNAPAEAPQTDSEVENSAETARLQAMAELPSELVVRGLAVTGVDSTLKRKFNAKIRKLQASYNDNVTDKVTHLVAGVDFDGRVKRTIKYLSALLRGLWIVSEQFVNDSAAAGSWLHPEAYVVMGVKDDDASDGVPLKAVQHRLAKKPGLFAGKTVLLHSQYDKHRPHDVPPRSAVAALLVLGGATIVEEDDEKAVDLEIVATTSSKAHGAAQAITPVSLFDAISHWTPLA
eukprot:m.34442 g.34442  ORF g.34442 m.34442 type:complete len:669 (-) comp12305_c0_seq2:381-2387(-)